MTVSTFIAENAATCLAIGGLVIGSIFGAVAQRTGFCTLGAISDWTLFGDKRRARSWILAVAVALLGAQALHTLQIVDLNTSLYLSGSMPLGGHILGGLLFGFGMVLSGGCVSRNLVRAGSGDLRAMVSLLFVSIIVAVTLGGILGPLRVALVSATSTAGPLALDPSLTFTVAAAAAAALAAYCFADRDFRTSAPHLVAGLAIGLCVVAGWAMTGLAFDEFADQRVQAQSLTFVKPVADSIDWLERATALGIPPFAVTSVGGVLLGALSMSLATGTFRIATFAGTRDTVRNLAGAGLMAIGGVLALGCSIGQGITGLSTLSLGSLVATLSIVVGSVIGLKASERYSILT